MKLLSIVWKHIILAIDMWVTKKCWLIILWVVSGYCEENRMHSQNVIKQDKLLSEVPLEVAEDKDVCLHHMVILAVSQNLNKSILVA